MKKVKLLIEKLKNLYKIIEKILYNNLMHIKYHKYM